MKMMVMMMMMIIKARQVRSKNGQKTHQPSFKLTKQQQQQQLLLLLLLQQLLLLLLLQQLLLPHLGKSITPRVLAFFLLKGLWYSIEKAGKYW